MTNWSHPVLHTLTHLPIPIGFIYGENDNIISPHQGIAFSKMTNNNIPVNVIPNAFHSPQHSHPIECSHAIIDIFMNTSKRVPQKDAHQIKKMVPQKDLENYYGSYDINYTSNVIQEMYSKLCM